jgi:osmoprotectant transport system permease protein
MSTLRRLICICALSLLAGSVVAASARDDFATPASTTPTEAVPSDNHEQMLVRVGSKAFTENVVLAELVVHLAESEGFTAEHVEGLGGTRLLWEALLAGQIDVYPEYTGTMSEEILAGKNVRGVPALRSHLATLGLELTEPLGFNNTYVLGMKEDRAAELGIRTISDLRDHPELALRFSNEFMKRADGWEALATRYNLPHEDVRGLEHALAYEALDQGVIDVTDLYATDAKIEKLQLRRLVDDLQHFPQYHAVYVYRADLRERAPSLVAALHSLEGTIDAATMTSLNARVELDSVRETQAAADYLAKTRNLQATVREKSTFRDIMRYTGEHLNMVGVSLIAAMLVAVPLGVAAARWRRLAQPILGVAGIIQTIPSIALLVLLIRPISYVSNELGYPQAVVALFLYSLLPIIRNTYTGLHSISPQMIESAAALGLPASVRLWKIELPLASRTVLAGIKTAAVINVGFATLGGFIGAGGYGEPIFTGIRLNDYGVILQGALPAAALALLVQGLFEIVDRLVVPRGLRLKPVA